MSQFFVYQNTNKDTNKTYPFFVNVQTSMLDNLNSRVVVPLMSKRTLKKRETDKLCPLFTIEGKVYVLMTHQVTSIPKSALKKEVCSLEQFRHEISSAMDFMLTGI